MEYVKIEGNVYSLNLYKNVYIYSVYLDKTFRNDPISTLMHVLVEFDGEEESPVSISNCESDITLLNITLENDIDRSSQVLIALPIDYILNKIVECYEASCNTSRMHIELCGCIENSNVVQTVANRICDINIVTTAMGRKSNVPDVLISMIKNYAFHSKQIDYCMFTVPDKHVSFSFECI